jgi:hypothetical protein
MVIHRQFDSTNGPTVIDSNIYYYYRQMSETIMFSILIRAAKLLKQKLSLQVIGHLKCINKSI